MKHLILGLISLMAFPPLAAAQRRPTISPHQKFVNPLFSGEVAVDAQSDVALVGMSNGSVLVMKPDTAGQWNGTGIMTGSTSAFGIEIAFDGGWALIAEDQSAGLIRSYQYVNGSFLPAGIIYSPGIPSNTAFGYGMAISADGWWAAVGAFDYDDPGVAGADHGIAFVYQRTPAGEWAYRGMHTAGAAARDSGRFGQALALSRDGSQLVIGHNGSVHIVERRPESSSTFIYEEVKVVYGGASQASFGFDVDIAEDGQTVVVGEPLNGHGGGFALYRRDGGTWNRVGRSSFDTLSMKYADWVGWTVAVSETVVATLTPRVLLPTWSFYLSGFYAWGNDVDVPERWWIDSYPSSGPSWPEGPGGSKVEISMDGRWIFLGMHSNIVDSPAHPELINSHVFVLSISTPPALQRRSGDYDGDGAADLTVYRLGAWYSLPATSAPLAAFWGIPGDLPVPADYDGDGITDRAVYRPANAAWYVLQTTTGTGVAQFWGIPGDVPVPADYDGDGKTDFAVYRPSTAAWWILRSTSGTASAVFWGIRGDQPVPADFDGDGKADPTVFRPSTGVWYQLLSSSGTAFAVVWGAPGDVPLAGDYDGDGSADPTVFRSSTGAWYQLRSRDGATFGGYWGAPGDVPIVGDYDGDGKADLTVYRSWTNVWYVLRSQSGSGFAIVWGMDGDIPM